MLPLGRLLTRCSKLGRVQRGLFRPASMGSSVDPSGAAPLQYHTPYPSSTIGKYFCDNESSTKLPHSATGQTSMSVVYDPPYLDALKPKVGYYELVNLQIKGFDYVILEKYQSYLHKTMRKMGFNVVNTWSAPHQELNLESLAPCSSAVESTTTIKIYERNLQIKEALVTKLPILIDIINITTPPGVSFNIHRHSAEDENKLYFEDSVLKSMKEEYKELSEQQLIGA